MTRILTIVLFFTVFCSFTGCGQQNNSTKGDSLSKWYNGEFNENKLLMEEYPLKPTGWVNDYEQVLTKSQLNVLDSTISVFEKRTSIEIAVFTIDSSFVSRDRFDEMVSMTGKIWGVGKKDTDNGIIIGFSASLAKVRISTAAGIRTKLPDTEAKKIIEEKMVPAFKNANFFEGIKAGLLAIMAMVE